MRISDWSSDVCSSDLADQIAAIAAHAGNLGMGFQTRPLRYRVTTTIDDLDAGLLRSGQHLRTQRRGIRLAHIDMLHRHIGLLAERADAAQTDRKSTRLNSRH